MSFFCKKNRRAKSSVGKGGNYQMNGFFYDVYTVFWWCSTNHCGCTECCDLLLRGRDTRIMTSGCTRFLLSFYVNLGHFLYFLCIGTSGFFFSMRIFNVDFNAEMVVFFIFLWVHCTIWQSATVIFCGRGSSFHISVSVYHVLINQARQLTYFYKSFFL